MNKKQITSIILIAFFIGAAGSIFFGRLVFPYFGTFPGWSWLNKLSTNAPIIINRTQEIQLNEGVNIIDLVRQSGNVTVSLYGVTAPDSAKLLGNGTIMSADGLIFTSRSAISSLGSGKLVVVLNDGAQYDATVGPIDPRSDLVVLTVPARNLPAAQLSGARELVSAQRIIGIGSSKSEGLRRFLTGFVTNGMNNAQSLDRVFTTNAFEETIETDASISADYYGGPVINLNGKVVGIMANTRGGILPAENLQTALASYLANGKIIRPFAGIKYMSLSESTAKLKNLPQAGALVVGFENPSAAKTGGLLVNDLIVAVAGLEINDQRSFEYLFNQQPTTAMTLKVIRAGAEMEIVFTPDVNE